MSKSAGILAAVACAGIGLAGCARTPTALRGDFYAPISPAKATLEHRTGALVRWGGRILSVQHGDDHTCFDVLSQPLDSRAKPETTDEGWGRYRACASGFYDPAVYEEGRQITTVGMIERETTQTFDSFDLPVPVLSADVVYLWPRRRFYGSYPYPATYPWGWGPYSAWGPYWGPWWGVGFGYPYYGYGYAYRYPYRHGHRHHRGHAGRPGRDGRGGRMVRGGSSGTVGGGGGQRAPIGRR